MDKFDCERILIDQITNHHSRTVLIDQYCSSNFISYNMVELYYSKLNQNAFFMSLLIGLAFPVLFLCISHVASKFLAVGMKDLSSRLRLSPSIAAISLISFANGAPDLISAMIGQQSSEKLITGLGMFYGGFVFGVCAVMGRVITAAKRPIMLPKLQIFKESIFFLLGLGVVAGFAYRGKAGVSFLVSYFLLYLLYVLATIVLDRRSGAGELELGLEGREFEEKSTSAESIELPQVAEEGLTISAKESLREDNLVTSIGLGTVLRRCVEEEAGWLENLVLVPMNFAVMFSVPYQTNPMMRGKLRPLVLGLTSLTLMLSFELLPLGLETIAMGSIFFVCLHTLIEILLRRSPETRELVHEALAIFGAVAWIKILASFIVDFIAFLAFYFDFNEVILASILLSAGNGAADFFGNGALAQRGEEVMAAMASYSGQVFNSFIGFGFLVLRLHLQGSDDFDLFNLNECHLDALFNNWETCIGGIFVAFTMFFIVAFVLANLLYLSRKNYTMDLQFAFFLYATYVSFLLLSTLFVVKSN